MEVKEYTRYKDAIEKLFYIVDKEGTRMPFRLNGVQDKVLKNLQDRDIILKSRQQGMSSLILAMFAVDFLTVENTKCVVISHESSATQRLFDRVKYYLESVKETFPYGDAYNLKYNSRHEMVNTVKNSTFYIGTAGARAFGHGDTINNLHVSELSRWENQERTMSGLLQAVPKNGRVVVETTANGYGNYFHNMWILNQSRQEPFHTHFLPWFETPEYALPVPDDIVFDPDELEVMNAYHLNRQQMYWRRYKIGELNGNLDRFNEQYPATPEEAFIVSGNPVWSPAMLRWYMLKVQEPQAVGNLVGYDPVTVEKNEKGYLKVFKPPNEFHRYVIGADVSEGIIVSEGEDSKERDFSCAQVLDATTYEQVAVWHGRIDPDLYGRQLEMLGRYYNTALIAVEKNAMGLTPLIVLRDLNYSNLYYRERFGLISEKTTSEMGWVTDSQSKEMIINDATHLFREKRIGIYDSDTISEMMSFVRGADGSARAARSSWDDRVMALLIAIKMLTRPQGRRVDNEIERLDIETRKGTFVLNGVSFNAEGWPIDPDDSAGEMSETLI